MPVSLGLADLYGGDVGNAPDVEMPPDLPFTTADSLELQKLQQGQASARQQLNSGEITPQDHDQLQGILSSQLGPLVARQKAAQQQARQEAYGQLQEQSAHLEAIDHGNAVFRAQGLQDRVATYTDPLTGQTAHLIEDGPKKWREIAFPEVQADSATTSVGPSDLELAGRTDPAAQGADPYAWERQRQTPPSESSQASWGEPPAVRAQSAFGPVQGEPPTSPGSPQIEPAPDGGHVMTIINGPNVERYHFAPDGTTTLLQNQGPQAAQAQQSQQPGVALNQSEIAVLRDRARKSVPAPQLTGNPRLDQPRQAQWQKAVDGLAGHLVQAETQRRQNAMKAQDQAGEHARQEGVRESLEKQKEQARADAEKQRAEHRDNQQRTEQQLSQSYRHHLAEVKKEAKEGATFADPAAEAWRRVDEETKGTHQRTGGKVPEAAAAPEKTDRSWWQWATGQQPQAAPQQQAPTPAEQKVQEQRAALQQLLQGVAGGQTFRGK